MSDQFDEPLAMKLVGKTILVGITYVDQNEKPIEQKQFHGRIASLGRKEGLVIALHGSGGELKLPPDLSSVKVAPPGEYRLRSTGEVVVNPDLTATWTVKKPGVQ